MMITAENAIQNVTTTVRRSVHQTNFLRALVHAVVLWCCGALDYPPSPGGDRRWEALAGDLTPQAADGQSLARRAGVVASIEMHHHLRIGDAQRIQRGDQQGGIVTVGRGGDGAERDAGCSDGQGSLETLLAEVDGTATGHFASARCLGNAAANAQVREVQADHAVIGLERELEQYGHHTGGNPLVPPASERGR